MLSAHVIVEGSKDSFTVHSIGVCVCMYVCVCVWESMQESAFISLVV